MGDPRLLRVSEPVREFGTPELRALVDDMFETMEAANGAGLAVGLYRNLDELAGALRSVLQAPVARERIHAHARQFSWERTMSAYDELLRQAAMP